MSAIERPFTCKADERVAQQLRIEEMIRAYRPDEYEAQELIGAILKRFRDEEVDLYYTSLCKSLDRYEARNTPSIDDDQDDAYELWRARQEP